MATYIGVDIGKKSLHIYFPIVDKFMEVTNNLDGFNNLLSAITKYYNNLTDLIIVFEPTGGYEQALRDYLRSNNIYFTTVHPNKVRAYAKAKGGYAKTDKIDSKLLHDYADKFVLPVKQTYHNEIQTKLHGLLKRREQLILFKNQEISRLETENNSLVISSLEKHILELTEALTQIQEHIQDLINNDPIIKEKITKLTSIPGVGITLATNIICELPELGNIKFTSLTALVGLAPYARESGAYKGKRAIFAGKANLRKVLYMASVASLRCNKRLRAFYDRLINAHKPPKLALVAVMRKLLAFIHAIAKHNSSWNNSIS